MTFLGRILFWIGIMVVSASAEIPSCRVMTQSATECDPYVISFLKITQMKKRAASLRHRPLTGKLAPIEEKIRVKNGMTLHHLVSKYIKREERFYVRSERKRQQRLSAQKTIENPQKPPQQETIPVPSPHKETKPSPKPSPEIFQHIEPRRPQEAEQTPQPRKPLETVILTPETKPIPTRPTVLKENKSSDLQPPIEVILPAEPLDIQQKKPKDNKQGTETEFAVYVVKKGDSLLGIAKRFGVEAKVLIEINQLEEDPVLKAGQKLYIPLPQEDVDAIDNATYIVKKGDTLSGIAKHFHVKVSDLTKYNKVRKKSVIHIGQVLILPLPRKLLELKRIEAQKRKAALKKKRERERLARIALKKAKRARFLKLSKGLKHKLSVTATAYTSHHSQTDKTPFLAAWNNRIRPGMKIIAVSRDLIYKYGITNGKKVRISGLPGIYTVRDKMNKKWRRKIDIYMGTSRHRALRWGRRRVTLYY